MQINRNFSLDFIKGVSILLIIYYHYNCAIVRIISNELVLSNYYGFTSPIGVSLFFILSGASLTLSTKENYSIFSFFRKRFLSIFPLFWMTYILATFANSLLFQYNHFAGKNPLTFFLTIFGIDGFLFLKIPNYY